MIHLFISSFNHCFICLIIHALPFFLFFYKIIYLLIQEDDEKDLVGDMEEQAEEVEEIKGNVDFKGKIHWKLEYDFTTQELKVTVGKH